MKELFADKRKLNIALMAIVVAIYFIRVINLDADVLPYSASEYMQPDEGYYAVDAIRIARPEITKAQTQIDDTGLRQWHTSDSWIITVLTALSLKVFGNNYYGLRMGSVISGLLITLILIYLMNKMRGEGKGISIWIPVASLLTSYGFLLATRTVEPSIGRSLFLMVFFLAVYTLESKKKYNVFWLGLIATVCVVLSYPTNIFIIGACGCLVIIESLINRDTLKAFFNKILVLMGGGISGYLVGEALYLLIQKRSFLLQSINDVNAQSNSLISFGLGVFKDNICAYIKHNSLIFTPAILVVLPFAVAWCLYKGIKKNNRIYILCALSIGIHFIQSVFISDFVARKSIVIYPVLLMALYFFLKDMDEVKRCFERIKYKVVPGVAFVLLYLVIGYFAYRKVCSYPTKLLPSGEKVLLLFFVALQMIGLLIVIAYEKQSVELAKAFMILGIVVLVIPNVIMYKIPLFVASKSEKEAMLSIGDCVGKSYVLGGLPYSCCFYNDIIPLSNGYDSYLGDEYIKRNQMLMAKDEVEFFIGEPQSIAILEKWSEGTEYSWELIRKFKTDYYVDESKPDALNFALFKKVKK